MVRGVATEAFRPAFGVLTERSPVMLYIVLGIVIIMVLESMQHSRLTALEAVDPET